MERLEVKTYNAIEVWGWDMKTQSWEMRYWVKPQEGDELDE